MKISLFILGICFSISVIAQPAVSGSTSPAIDTVILLPTNSIVLTGIALQANPGHPILDTTWTETSGPAATITNPSNRMTTTVTGLVPGTYIFTLTATDKKNSASASVHVTVLSGILNSMLAYFNVSRNDNGVLITWQTDMESNNAGFVIQESINGSAFLDVVTIPSRAKGGNSNIPLNYSYQIANINVQADMHNLALVIILLASTMLIGKLKKLYKCLVFGIVCLLFFSCTKSVSVPDNVPSASVIAFRLKQVDLDSHINYSEIKLVK
jgi:hypothetical protein